MATGVLFFSVAPHHQNNLVTLRSDFRRIGTINSYPKIFAPIFIGHLNENEALI